MPSTSVLFEKQFGILINDVNKLVYDNKQAHGKIDTIVKQYALKGLLPKDYVISNFNIYIRKPYGQYVFDKNSDFFMNQEFTVSELDEESNSMITFLTGVFKDLWTNGITDETKDKIWTRLQILVKLCERWSDEKS